MSFVLDPFSPCIRKLQLRLRKKKGNTEVCHPLTLRENRETQPYSQRIECVKKVEKLKGLHLIKVRMKSH